MSCNHLPNVTCDWCQHLHASRPGIYIATSDGTLPMAMPMQQIPGFGMVPKQMPMTSDQAAWSAGWAEGYQAGMQFAGKANEAEVGRLQNERDELRSLLRWYVDQGDINSHGDSAIWNAGRRRAMRALGIEVADE